jgi:hypothetical protein
LSERLFPHPHSLLYSFSRKLWVSALETALARGGKIKNSTQENCQRYS